MGRHFRKVTIYNKGNGMHEKQLAEREHCRPKDYHRFSTPSARPLFFFLPYGDFLLPSPSIQRSQRKTLNVKPAWWNNGSALPRRETPCSYPPLEVASLELLLTGIQCVAYSTTFVSKFIWFIVFITLLLTSARRTPPAGMEAHIPVLFLDLNGEWSKVKVRSFIIIWSKHKLIERDNFTHRSLFNWNICSIWIAAGWRSV